MTPTTYGREFAYCLKSHGGVRGFNASLWRFLLRCTLFCHSVATFLTSVSSYEGGCGFEDINIFPTVGDIENINIWAEIGVIFLLFALGLEFSFKKLMNVGSTAFITAITEVISMLLIGYLVGQLLGWGTMNSIFLGGMLSMSSTTIIIKAFNDLELRNQRFTGIVFGTLVVEDLIAILMMVLLSTMAVSQDFVGEDLLISVLKVVFFLVIIYNLTA